MLFMISILFSMVAWLELAAMTGRVLARAMAPVPDQDLPSGRSGHCRGFARIHWSSRPLAGHGSAGALGHRTSHTDEERLVIIEAGPFPFPNAIDFAAAINVMKE
jgi:hypothetical protein